MPVADCGPWPTGQVRLQSRSYLGVGRRGDDQPRPISVTPDAIVAIAPGGEVIVDANYKGRIAGGRTRISESDLYESLAFARATKLPVVILAYPRVGKIGEAELGVGTTNVFERIRVDEVSVIAVEVDVRGLAGSGGLRKFANGLSDGVRTAANSGPT